MAGRPGAKLGDVESGHSCFPPTKLIVGSNNVMTNKRPAARVGDAFIPHWCPNAGCHSPMVAKGSSKVIINGRPAARLGDRDSCGGVIMTGSSNVLIGG